MPLLASRVTRVALIGAVLAAVNSTPTATRSSQSPPVSRWFRTAWTTSMSGGSTAEGSNFSCRFVTRSTLTGDAAEVRLSNAMGSIPLSIDRASIAPRRTGLNAAAMPVPLTFGGRASTTIAPTADTVSDAAAIPISAGDDLLVTIHVTSPAAPITYHWVSEETNGCTSKDGSAGDHTMDTGGEAFIGTGSFDWWVDAVFVRTTVRRGSVVALGDSITDGACTAVDTHQRWTDVLARRLHGSVGVANESISGNRLEDGGSGPGAISRLDRDVLRLQGVSTLLLFEGTNDLAAGAAAETVLADMRRIVGEAHARGLRVVGATVIPRSSLLATQPQVETYRQRINQEIRTGGLFDAYVDFDRVEASTTDASELDPRYDCDHTHPNRDGLLAMGNAVPLAVLR